MKILLLIGFFYSFSCLAQQGPVSGCVTCKADKNRTEPYNGMWYNPEQSGTGFTIESQLGKVFGVYYGYDEVGKPTWLTFLADLIPSNEPNIMWTLDAEFQQFENGNCINCTYQTPSTTDFNGTIHIDFTQKNHAIVTMNNGAIQNIVPINYSQAASADFPDYSSYQLPDLNGLWTFVYKINSEQFPWQWAYKSNVYRIWEKQIVNRDGKHWVEYAVIFYDVPPESLIFGEIVCKLVENTASESIPECYFNDRLFYSGTADPVRFNFSLGGLGSYEIFGESEEGHTFRAIKVDSTVYPNG